MSLPLPYGNPEVVPNRDVDVFFREHVVPYAETLPLDNKELPYLLEENHVFPDGYIDVALKRAEYDIGDDGQESIITETRVIIEVGVSVSEAENTFWKYTVLLDNERPDRSYARRIRDDDLHFYRVFIMSYDPDDETILFVERRTGFFDFKERNMFDLGLADIEERDDSHVCEDEFRLLVAAIKRISRR